MRPGVNRSNMKTVLYEPENVAWYVKQMAQCCCIGTYISLRHHTFTYVYWISVLHSPVILHLKADFPLKGRFPLGKMNSDLSAKFIWACTFLFVYSLAGKILLFKIVKMNLINLRREKSPQLSEQSKHKCSTLSSNKFPSDQIEDSC